MSGAGPPGSSSPATRHHVQPASHSILPSPTRENLSPTAIPDRSARHPCHAQQIFRLHAERAVFGLVGGAVELEYRLAQLAVAALRLERCLRHDRWPEDPLVAVEPGLGRLVRERHGAPLERKLRAAGSE